jgi:hypothetical protein
VAVFVATAIAALAATLALAAAIWLRAIFFTNDTVIHWGISDRRVFSLASALALTSLAVGVVRRVFGVVRRVFRVVRRVT